jgi:histidinol dehydrogenase
MIKVYNSTKDKETLYNSLKERQIEDADLGNVVLDIINNVKARGDIALKEYSKKFDNVDLEGFIVEESEISNAIKRVEEPLINSLRKAKNNIESFHSRQVKKSDIYKKENEDVILGQILRPIERVGIYVPGGSASYPSTVLMSAVPAKLAGVEEIVMITPPDENGCISDEILAAAEIAGVDKIYKIGGAQGIAALSYGTESIEKVSKIVGPGNIYVTLAKKFVSGIVGIDMIAGPSEIVVVADRWANPKYIAADMLSQAEHDERASAILLTDCGILARRVISELEIQTEKLNKKDTVKKSLSDYGKIIVTDSITEAIDIVNIISPEHLELLTVDAFEMYKKIKNAGAIFIGEYSPEPVGDYFAGTNHILPTCATAKYSSALSVEDFMKKSSLIYFGKSALLDAKEDIIRIAESEGLTAHGNAIKIRFEEE